MAPPGRNGTGARSSIRPPTRTTSRQGYTRQGSVAPRTERTRAASPAESLMSVATSATAGMKRKERDFDPDEGGEATNINVVVRCRGRNEREVRENSAVVLSTEAAMGKTVELSMGPAALSNKAYNFDRVFSQAADQAMIFDDVVKPILDEVIIYGAILEGQVLTLVDAHGVQLHHLRLRPNRHGKNVHHVW